MSVHSSQSRDCLVSVRCVVVDHYQAEPVAGLDPLVSDFTGYNIRKVPIIRCVMSEPCHSVLLSTCYIILIGRDEIILFSYYLSMCQGVRLHPGWPALLSPRARNLPLPLRAAAGPRGTRGHGRVGHCHCQALLRCRVLSEPDEDIESGGCTDWRPASIVPSTSPWARLELVGELTRAHQSHVQGRAAVQHVYKAVVVTGLPMYGYHPRQHSFVKIYLYNPHLVRRAAELLQVRAS